MINDWILDSRGNAAFKSHFLILESTESLMFRKKLAHFVDKLRKVLTVPFVHSKLRVEGINKGKPYPRPNITFGIYSVTDPFCDG